MLSYSRALALVLCVTCVHADQAVGGREVAVWLPAPGTAQPWPVVVFSHGFHGCAHQSDFLTTALARAGYAVYAPNHEDAACRDLAKWSERAAQPLGDPRAWSDATYANRRGDVVRILDALGSDPRLDLTRVAVVGHSLGGYTALGVAGAWSTWRDARVKAVVALSPYVHPFVQKRTLGALPVPVMYQGGTLDIGITPFILRRGGAYELTRVPKALVVFAGAGHFAFTQMRATFQPSIIAYTVAFLDDVLRGRPIPAGLAKAHGDVRTVKLEMTRP